MLVKPFFESSGSHSDIEGFGAFNFSFVNYVFNTTVVVQGAFCGVLAVTCFLACHLVQGSGYFFLLCIEMMASMFGQQPYETFTFFLFIILCRGFILGKCLSIRSKNFSPNLVFSCRLKGGL